MSWISEYVRPKIKAFVQKEDMPDDLWSPCKKCSKMSFHRDLIKNFQVCPHCGAHLAMPVKERFGMLFDEGKCTVVKVKDVPTDPLNFKDKKRYNERLKAARTKTKRKDAITVAHGTLAGRNAVVVVFDFGFMGGSMGRAVGEAIIKAAEVAVAKKAALIVVPSSGGARMQEGIFSLMQMPRTTIAVEQVKEAGLPYIVLLANPTTGGVSASFAMLGDIQISEPNALICFAGARVIEETIREKLPEGFQRAEYLLEHGMIDMVVERKNMHDEMSKVLTHLMPAPQEEKSTQKKDVK
ncbi:MAG: acetyl-CoA carboxylase, carboxyltransferase subunit beta [Alphaproteobacteria bacterium]